MMTIITTWLSTCHRAAPHSCDSVASHRCRWVEAHRPESKTWADRCEDRTDPWCPETHGLMVFFMLISWWFSPWWAVMVTLVCGCEWFHKETHSNGWRSYRWLVVISIATWWVSNLHWFNSVVAWALTKPGLGGRCHIGQAQSSHQLTSQSAGLIPSAANSNERKWSKRTMVGWCWMYQPTLWY